MLKLRHKAASFLRIKIGNGEDTYFWWDPFGPLIHFLGPQAPSSLGIPLFSLVKDCLSDVGWNLPHARSDIHLQLFTFITTIPLSASSDIPLWLLEDKHSRVFSSKSVWNNIRPTRPQVTWFSQIWHKAAIPKHATTAWLFTLNRNPTLDRMISWGLDVEDSCLLCGSATESRDHLFFQWHYSSQIWNRLVRKLLPILLWLRTIPPSRKLSIAILQCWQACIYEIWKERNRWFHSGLTSSPEAISRKILLVVRNKSIALKNLGWGRGTPSSFYGCLDSISIPY